MASVASSAVIKFKIHETSAAEEQYVAVATAATDLCASVGLPPPTRVFRPAPKFEDKHRKAGLHLWYQVNFPDESMIDMKIAEIQERKDKVDKAELQPTARMMGNRGGESL